jgi:hypothetical protein
MAGVKIMLAMPTYGNLPSATVHSLLRTQGELMSRGIDVMYNTWDGCSLVHKARSNIALGFLESDCTHLFWVDSDLCWQSKDFLKLAALCTKMEVVCAAYPAKQDEAAFYLGYKDKVIELNEYGCVDIKHIAMGFSVVQRKVIEALAAKAPLAKTESDGEPTPRIFRLDIHNGQERGEDIAYFDDIRELGFKVWLCPTVNIGHVGQKVYDHKITEWIKSECVSTPSQ